MEFEYMSNEGKVCYIKEMIPTKVYKVFTKEWDSFVDVCGQNSSEFIEGDDFDKYFSIFMKYPH